MLVPVTRVNEIEALYERRRLNVQVERGSPFTSTRELPYNASILFTRQWKSTLREKNTKKGFVTPFETETNTVKRCCALAFHLNFQSPSFYSHTITVNT